MITCVCYLAPYQLLFSCMKEVYICILYIMLLRICLHKTRNNQPHLCSKLQFLKPSGQWIDHLVERWFCKNPNQSHRQSFRTPRRRCKERYRLAACWGQLASPWLCLEGLLCFSVGRCCGILVFACFLWLSEDCNFIP